MRAKRRKICATIALLIMAATSQARAEDLRSAWTSALSTNQQLQSTRYGTAAARRTVDAARDEHNPTVRTVNAYTVLSTTPVFKATLPAQTSHGVPGVGGNFAFPFLNRDFFVSSTLMNVPIYTSGRINAAIRAAEADACAAVAGESAAVTELKLQIAEAYLKVLRAQKQMMLAQSSVVSLQAQARDAKNLLDQGVVSRNDLLAADVSLAKARRGVIAARNAMDGARSAYNRLLGRPLTAPVQLDELNLPAGGPTDLAIADDPSVSSTTPGDDAQIQQLTAVAIRNRPELARFTQQARSAAAQADAVRAARMPQVAVIGGYTYFQNSHFGNPNFASGTVVGEWTLFDGSRSRHKSEALHLKELQALKQRGDTTSQIALSVRDAWLAVQDSRASLQVAEAAIAQSNENLRESRDRYRQQAGTSTEVLGAETLRVQTYTDYYDAYYSILLADFRLRRVVGGL